MTIYAYDVSLPIEQQNSSAPTVRNTRHLASVNVCRKFTNVFKIETYFLTIFVKKLQNDDEMFDIVRYLNGKNMINNT